MTQTSLVVGFVVALAACHGDASESAGAEATAGTGAAGRCADTECLAELCEQGHVASCGTAAHCLAASALRSDRERAVHLHDLACTQNVAEDCAALADDLESGVFIPRDAQRAAALRAAACEQGVQDACYRLALQHIGGDGVAKDAARGEQLLVGACEARFADACRYLGYYDGKPALSQRASDLYLAACHAGDAAACQSAAWLYGSTQVASDVPRADWEAVAAATRPACTGGDADACAVLATVLFQSNLDRDASLTYRTRACELGSIPACAFIAETLYFRGDSKPLERAIALSAAERACQLGDASSCVRVRYFVDDPGKRRALLLRGCDLGDEFACDEAKRTLLDPTDLQRVKNQLCSQGRVWDCVSLASDAQQRGDLAGTRGFYVRACREKGGGEGCRGYAKLVREACDGNDPASCDELTRFLAALSPGKRGLAVFECCRDRPEASSLPAVHLAAFADALQRGDARAIRSFVHPKRGMKVEAHVNWKRGVDKYAFRIGTRSNLKALHYVSSLRKEIEWIECLEAFLHDTATCTVAHDKFTGTYQLLRHGGRVYLVKIEHTD